MKQKNFSLSINIFTLIVGCVFCLQLKAQNVESQPKKVLFLGDSFTVGTGLEDGEQQQAFPYQLINKLNREKIPTSSPQIVATDGDTTKHLLGALNVVYKQSNPDNQDYAPGDFDLVVLSIGINDLFRGHTVADYSHHFKELLDRAIRFAKDDVTSVMVISIPAWDASPSVYNNLGTEFRYNKYQQVKNNINEVSIPIKDINFSGDKVTIQDNQKLVEDKIAAAKAINTQDGIAAEIDSFNLAAKNIAEKANVQFIDITSLTRIQPDKDDVKYDSMFAKDGIHYSAAMYEKWVDYMYPEAYAKLIVAKS